MGEGDRGDGDQSLDAPAVAKKPSEEKAGEAAEIEEEEQLLQSWAGMHVPHTAQHL